MKKCIFMVLYGLVCLFCQSCQSEDIEANDNHSITDEINANIEGTLLDGGEISDISLYCIENNKSMIGKQWYEYYPATKTVSDYSSFKLILMLNRNAPIYVANDIDERASIAKIEYEYVKEKSQFIYENYKKYKESNPARWPDLFTSYINGELSITCDKVLFGEQPGTNLSLYFTVSAESPCIPIGIENPKLLYEFGEELPVEVQKLFAKGTWLQPEYFLQFAKLPSEKYEDLTLHVTLPMIIEHVRDIAVSKYKGINLDNKYSESVFKTDCLIKFNWN